MIVILGNDHRLFMDALADVLSQHGVAVAARAVTPHEVLVQVARHEPDICLVAGRWWNGDGADSLRLMRMHHPAVNVVILCDGPVTSGVAAAIDLGAAAVVSQHQHVADLVETLYRVRAGKRPVTEPAAGPVIRSFSPPVSSVSNGLLDVLTIREQEVLRLMTDGRATKEIAKSLAITLPTARRHVQSVLVKLGVHSRLEASWMVARMGLLDPTGQFTVSAVSREAAVSG